MPPFDHLDQPSAPRSAGQADFIQGNSSVPWRGGRRNRPSLPHVDAISALGEDQDIEGDETEPVFDAGSLLDQQREEQAEPDPELDHQREAEPGQHSGPIGHDNHDPHRPDDPDDPDDNIPINIQLEDLKIATAFVDAVRDATLENGNLPSHVLERLRNPPRGPRQDLDPDLRHSLELFISTLSGSEDTYTGVRDASLRRHPDDDILSLAQVKRAIEELTGVVAVKDDMCKQSCLAFVGPFEDLTTCPICGTPRFKPVEQTNGKTRVPQAQFDTMLITPQLQALWASPESATASRYRRNYTNEILTNCRNADGEIEPTAYSDIFAGSRYLEVVESGELRPEDMCLMYSIDGLQLYSYKQSDMWIYIWVILDLPPNLRYKKKYVIPGCFIPGPNKPKNVDSFIFRGFHHLSAVQKEGIRIWDACEDRYFTSRPWLLLSTADAVAQVELDGLVGHRGKLGCRFTCPMEGRHKPGDSTHYMPHLAPENYTVQGCSQEDINIDMIAHNQRSPEEYQRQLRFLLESSGPTQYKSRRLKTGIVKPTIISGLSLSLGIPGTFGMDLMHLVTINLTDLLVRLWRGTISCAPTDSKASWDWAVLKGQTWIDHGQAVADATPYLPGSFDRVPRDPAKKISSGYKAWEFLMYIFGLGPALLRGTLPPQYWKNFCSLARAVRLLHQKSIGPRQLALVHALLCQFVLDFEQLYYQRREDRMHFCPLCVHLLIHCAPEIVQIGPMSIRAQWTLERTIGNLGQEVKQDVNPYANMSRRGYLRCLINALYAIYPELTPPHQQEPGLPHGSEELDGGYVLLRARDRSPYRLTGAISAAIENFVQEYTGVDYEVPRVIRWSRLRLPNGQIARCAWKENMKSLAQLRISRNVKVELS